MSDTYTYTYDKLNRLLSGTSTDGYNESGITYDLMGNITALNRYKAGTQIDQLAYAYLSSSIPTNQVQSIAESIGNSTTLLNGTTSYTYDPNGNMLSAANTVNTAQNKSFTYNLLNLPIVATVPLGTDSYTYDAMGNKLRKVSDISGVTTNTDYINGIQYSGITSETLSFIQTEEGKAVPNGTSYDYTYYLGDNLGNTRLTFDTQSGSATMQQQDDYYPFGFEINRSVNSPKNEYLYNKKELQQEFTEYDYGARFYDPVIARWNVVDPLSEISRRWSPYNYVTDNPIRLIDPDGMRVDSASQQEWNRQKQAITDQRNNLSQGATDLTALSKSSGVDFSGLIHGLQDKVSSLSGTLTNLTNLENSTQLYSLNGNGGEVGGTTMNTSTHAIVFTYSGTANFVHETTHGGQFEAGKIGFSRTTGRPYGTDIGDEVAAYKAQFAYDPSSISGLTSSSVANSFSAITSTWVQGITTSSGARPYSLGGNANTAQVPITLNSPRSVLMLAYPNIAGALQSRPDNFTLRSMSDVYTKP